MLLVKKNKWATSWENLFMPGGGGGFNPFYKRSTLYAGPVWFTANITEYMENII